MKDRNKLSFLDGFSARIAILLVLIVMFGCYGLRLGQDVNWDLLDYHFYNGYALLNGRVGWDIAPAMVQSYINPIYDVINYLIISSMNAKQSVFIISALSALPVFILFKITQLLFSNYKSGKRLTYFVLASAIGATGVAGLGTVGMATNDNYTALLTITSLYFAIRTIIGPHFNRYLILSGVISGLAAGCKLVSIAYVPGVILCVFFLPTKERSIKKFILILVSILFGFSVSNGWWMYKIYHLYQNPLFPYYNNIFHSPYAQINSYKDYRYYPGNIFAMPFQLAVGQSSSISDAVIQDLRLALLLSLLSVYLIIETFSGLKERNLSRNSVNTRVWCYVATWYITTLVLWYYMFTIYRYTIALELISGVLIVAILDRLIRNNFLMWIMAGIILTLLYKTTNYPSWGRIDTGKHFFSVTNIPKLPRDAVVLMYEAPFGYAIPYFQKDTRFIGASFINHEHYAFSAGDAHTNLADDAVNLLKSNSKKIYVLYAENRKSTVDSFILKFYSLEIYKHECYPLNTNMPDKRLYLCHAKLKV